ncbi:potassium channel family protein, partial [candidate division CSSED10-310 bacterium]
MKLLFNEFINLLKQKQERNIRILLKFFLLLALLITFYSMIFHFLMLSEGHEYSWITGFYWTLTVMSTLGFGDITFHTDSGKLFSIIVLLTGVLFLLTLMPFLFIQFLYLPWLESQSRAKAPREVPEDMQGHVILTNFDVIAESLIERFQQYKFDYVIIVPEIQKAIELHDRDYHVVIGEYGDPLTYKRTRVHKAALVIANVNDMVNTNIAFTIREIAPHVPIVTNADMKDSVDILELAGSTHVLQFMNMLGQSLARRVLGSSAQENVIGTIDTLLIAETPAMKTPLVGNTLQQTDFREKTGLTVVGIWERGQFSFPTAQTIITPMTVLLLAGSSEQLERYDQVFG